MPRVNCGWDGSGAGSRGAPSCQGSLRRRERGGVRSEGRGLGLRGDKAKANAREREGDRFTWSGEIRTRGKISFAIPSLLCF